MPRACSEHMAGLKQSNKKVFLPQDQRNWLKKIDSYQYGLIIREHKNVSGH